MKHKRVISISMAALMLVSLCAVCASTGVTAATDGRGTQPSAQQSTVDVVGAVPEGGLASSPAVASWGSGRLDIVAIGSEGHLWHKWFNGAWHTWEDLGVPVGGSFSTHSSPTVCSWGANRLDVFFVDTAGHLQQLWFNGAWQPLYQVGLTGMQASSPGAVAWTNAGVTRIDIFARGIDYAMWQRYYATGQGWLGWYNLGTIS